MNEIWLEHVNLATGHRGTSGPDEIDARTLAMLSTWLEGHFESGRRRALPIAGLKNHSATRCRAPGGLVVTIYGRDAQPLATVGVGTDARRAPLLWAQLCEAAALAGSVAKPAEPWCAIVPHGHPDWSRPDGPALWLGQFARAVAWCWANRTAQAVLQAEAA